MYLELENQKAKAAYDSINEREAKKKCRNVLVFGLVVSVLFLGVCYFANSVDQNPKVIDKNNQTDPELPNKEEDEKLNPPKPVVEDDGGV